MGESTDNILKGIFCQVCGQWMPDCFIQTGIGWEDEEVELDSEIFSNPPGHPRTCLDCNR